MEQEQHKPESGKRTLLSTVLIVGVPVAALWIAALVVMFGGYIQT